MGLYHPPQRKEWWVLPQGQLLFCYGPGIRRLGGDLLALSQTATGAQEPVAVK